MKRLFIATVLVGSAALAAEPAAPAPKTTPPVAQQPGTPRPPGQPGAPQQPSAAKKVEGPTPPRLTLNYAKPDVMAYTAFPTVELRTPNSATYVGIQFGTGKQEVIYICFDAEEMPKIHDRAWWYVAGGTNPPKPMLEKAQDEKVKMAKNVKIPKDKPQLFEFPPLHSRIGDTEVLSKISATYGFEQKASLLLDIDVVLKEPKGRAAFNLKGGAIDVAVPMPNEIKVIPLLTQPTLRIYEYLRVNPPWIRPYIAMTNRFVVQPINGMDDSFAVQVRVKGEGKVIDKGKLPVKIPDHAYVAESGAGQNYPLKSLRPGNAYEIETSIDLGPFGDLSGTTTITMPGKVKK